MKPPTEGAIHWALFWVVAAVVAVAVCMMSPARDAFGPGPWPAPTSPARP